MVPIYYLMKFSLFTRNQCEKIELIIKVELKIWGELFG